MDTQNDEILKQLSEPDDLSEPKHQYYFSLFSGQIYSVPEDTEVDAFQIPIIGPYPKHKNCKKCYGRLYTDYNPVDKHYTMCRKCMLKLLDIDAIDKKTAAARAKF